MIASPGCVPAGCAVSTLEALVPRDVVAGTALTGSSDCSRTRANLRAISFTVLRARSSGRTPGSLTIWAFSHPNQSLVSWSGADPSTEQDSRRSEKLVEHCTLPSQVVKWWDERISKAPPRPPWVEPLHGRRSKFQLDRPFVWREDQGMPTSVYVETARDLVDRVVITFDEAIANPFNAASTPVLQRLTALAQEFRAQLEKSLKSE